VWESNNKVSRIFAVILVTFLLQLMKSISSLHSCVKETSQVQNDKIQLLTTQGVCLVV